MGKASANQRMDHFVCPEPLDKLGHESRKSLMIGRKEDTSDHDRLLPVFAAFIVVEPVHDCCVQPPDEFLGPFEVGAQSGAIRKIKGRVVVQDLSDVRWPCIDTAAREHLVDLGGRKRISLDGRAARDRRIPGSRPKGDVSPAVMHDRALGGDMCIPGVEELLETGRILV